MLVATIGFEYELHRIYGRHLKNAGFDVIHHTDYTSLRAASAPNVPKVLVVSLVALGSSRSEVLRLVHAWPDTLIITSGEALEPQAAQSNMSAGIAGHLDWRTEKPGSIVHMIEQLYGIL